MSPRGYTRCPALGVFGTLVPDNRHCFGSSSRAKFTTVSGVLAFERIRHLLEVECDGLDSDEPIASPFDIRAGCRRPCRRSRHHHGHQRQLGAELACWLRGWSRPPLAQPIEIQDSQRADRAARAVDKFGTILSYHTYTLFGGVALSFALKFTSV